MCVCVIKFLQLYSTTNTVIQLQDTISFVVRLYCHNYISASVVQWLGFLPIDQKVMGSNPGRFKGIFF